MNDHSIRNGLIAVAIILVVVAVGTWAVWQIGTIL